MTVSFLQDFNAQASPSASLQSGMSASVGNHPLQATEPVTLGDEAREIAIREVSDEMEAAYRLWERTDKPSDYNEAHRLQKRLYDLVRGRSAAQVARMEAARGLA